MSRWPNGTPHPPRFNGMHPVLDPDWDEEPFDLTVLSWSMDPIAIAADGWFTGRTDLSHSDMGYRDRHDHDPLPRRHYVPKPLWSTPVVHPVWSTPTVTFLADIITMPVPVVVPAGQWQSWTAPQREPHDWEKAVAAHQRWLKDTFGG